MSNPSPAQPWPRADERDALSDNAPPAIPPVAIRSHDPVQEASIDGLMVFESVRDASGQISDFRWTYANEAAARMVGKPRAWLIGRCLLEELPGNRDAGLFDAYARVVETGEPWTKEFTYQHEGLDICIRLVAARAGDGFAVSFADLSERWRAEERLRESEARLAAFMAHSPGPMFIKDAAGRYTVVNQAFLADVARPANEVIGRTDAELFPPKTAAAFVAEDRAVRERGEAQRFEETFAYSEHAAIYLKHKFPLPGGAIGCVGIDISERKLVEERLRRLQGVTARFATAETLEQVRRVILDDMVSALGTTSGALRRVTQHGLVMVEYDLGAGISEETARRFALVPLQARHPAADAARSGKAVFNRDAEQCLAHYPNLAETVLRHGIQANAHLPLANGQTVFGVLSFNFFEPRAWDEAERTFALALADRAAIAYERARLFEDLRSSEERYRTLLDSIDQGFCVLEMLYDEAGKPVDYRFLAVNPNFERHTGLKDALGQTIRALVPGFEEDWIEIYGRVAETGEPLRFEQGSEALGRWFEVDAVRVGGAGSRRVALLFTDISERKQTEGDSRFLAALGEHIRVSEDADALLAEVARMTGEHLPVLRCYFVEVYEESDRWLVRSDYGPQPSMIGDYRLSTYPADMLALHRRGHVIHISDTACDPLVATAYETGFAPFGIRAIVIVPLLRDGHWVAELVVGAADVRDWQPRDITLLETVAERTWNAVEKLRLDAELRESEARFRNMADHAPVMIWMTGPDGSCTYLSKSWYAFTGRTPETGLGFGWIAASHPDDRAATEQTFHAANARHETFRHEYRLRHWDGAYRWVMDSAAPRFGPSGDFLGYIGSVIDITDRKRAEAEREQRLEQEQHLRAQSEEAGRLKDDFLATVSHELRTPLTSILGYGHLLQARKRDEAYVARAVETIMRSAKAQAQLIEDLLDVSRIGSGKLRLEPQDLDLSAVIEAAIETVRPALDAKALHLDVDLDPAASALVGDGNRLQQVVWNLLSNAVKFTPPDGTIQVRLQPDGGSAQLTISDTGQGIGDEFLPYVFDRFRQADSASTRSHGGLGLGLAIVRHLVELHGGTVHVASQGVGLGSTFTVRLPLRARATPHVAPTNTPDVANEDCPPELNGLRVLVVDDQPDIVALLCEVFEACGASVRAATAARDALTTLHTWQADVLVSDIAMPDEDGYWLLRAVRALAPEQGGNVPAIALTAYVRAEDRRRVLAAGFQRYVPKPVDPAELRAVVASIARPGRGERAPLC